MKNLLILIVVILNIVSNSASSGEIKVLQLNIWQEGTTVPNGYDAVIDEIAYADADFVLLSEVRNYNNTRLCDRMIASLRAKGKTYYSFKSTDSGILSKYPISDSVTIFPENDDRGSIYKLVATLDNGQRISIYTAHLDYRNCAYYRIRGYDGSTWAELSEPDTNLESILADNVASQRDDAIELFIVDAAKDAAAGNLIILGGDFNEPSHLDWVEATKNSADHNGMVVPWTVTTMLERAGYLDSYREQYPNPVTHPGYTYPADCPGANISQLSWAPKADERERIDYIFYRPDKRLKIKHVRIFGPNSSVIRAKRSVDNSRDPFLLPATNNWPTDHKGVLATFRIR